MVICLPAQRMVVLGMVEQCQRRNQGIRQSLNPIDQKTEVEEVVEELLLDNIKSVLVNNYCHSVLSQIYSFNKVQKKYLD